MSVNFYLFACSLCGGNLNTVNELADLMTFTDYIITPTTLVPLSPIQTVYDSPPHTPSYSPPRKKGIFSPITPPSIKGVRDSFDSSLSSENSIATDDSPNVYVEYIVVICLSVIDLLFSVQ
jgi:hypothetical protein